MWQVVNALRRQDHLSICSLLSFSEKTLGINITTVELIGGKEALAIK